MTTITFTGPADDALGVVTRLADADGVDLTSSEAPVPNGDGTVSVTVTVEGDDATVADAVARIDADLPSGATLDVL